MTRIPCLTAATIMLSVFAAGCSSLATPLQQRLMNADSSRPPGRCLCLWHPIESKDVTGQSVRGFGGQVYFFAPGSEEPIAVNGDVRVYVFDDVGTPDQQARPKRVVDYDSVEWASFLGSSQFGSVYSLFVPYQQRGNFETTCSVRLRLTRLDGSQLLSEMATVKLSGTPRDDKTVRQFANPGEQPDHSDRSSDLRVDLNRRSKFNSRTATIGSIEKGDFQLSDQYAPQHEPVDRRSDTAQGGDDPLSARVRRYELQLAEMQSAFAKGDSRQHPSIRNVNRDFSDLLPAIRNVSRDNRQSQQQVAPTAYEVFATEEPEPAVQIEPDNQSEQSAASNRRSLHYESRRSQPGDSDSIIRSLSRPLHPHAQPRFVPDRSDEDVLQALQLARISER